MRINQDRERTNFLFAIAATIGLFVFREMERRQALAEVREEARRNYVDSELAKLNASELGHAARCEGVKSIGMLIVGVATIAVAVVTVLGLLAAHTI